LKGIFKYFIFLTYTLFISSNSSCNSFEKLDATLLKGYWKIDFVSKNNEVFKFKEDSFILDYYFLNKNSGWRKKVKPLFNNRFETSIDTTFFKIKNQGNKSILFFQTKWHNWEEMIIGIDSVSLILKIKDKMYHYKKIKP
tara:strand:+ start:80 stop:499 length:420 start_codon:yes stop_codon:yes gene_type:complete